MLRRPDASDRNSVRYRFRKRRFEWVAALLREIAARQGTVSVLDIGGRRDYWNHLAPELRPVVKITLLNFAQELEDHPENIAGLQFTPVVGDGCSMPEFEDGAFDLAHSNSVIEHVGSLANMIRFADEVRRVGNGYYVQTPYLWFPLEPHYGVPGFQWLPAPTRAQIMNRRSVGFAPRIEDYRRALEQVDHVQLVDQFLMRGLFPDAELRKERFMLMTKSLVSIRRPRFGEQ